MSEMPSSVSTRPRVEEPVCRSQASSSQPCEGPLYGSSAGNKSHQVPYIPKISMGRYTTLFIKGQLCNDPKLEMEWTGDF